MQNAQTAAGDMPISAFREAGHQLVDWIAAYFANIDATPVLPEVAPGAIRARVPETPPAEGEAMPDILRDIDRIIMPGMTHWNHPDFHAYFSVTGSLPGILGEFLAAAFNINGMVWTSCPASTELEQATTNWVRRMLGLPDAFWGIIYDTASTSTLHALAAAREMRQDLQIREKGMPGRVNVPRLRLYLSEHAHSSVEKAALTLGLGLDSVRKIPVDHAFRLRPEALQAAVAEDRAAGWLPFCTVATIGTTSVTSADPVEDMHAICAAEKMWLHVDAAYAGPGAVLPELAAHFRGWEKADSVVVNPHKWLFVPIDCSLLYTRHPDVLRRAFSLVPEYLKTSYDEDVENYMDYGIQLGRRFRAIKLWFVLRYFGVEGIRKRLRYHLRLAQDFAGRVATHPDFELMAPVPFSLVVFRAHPEGMDENRLNSLNQRLLEAINATREVFLSHTKLDGKFVIRMAIGNIRTDTRHIEKVWNIAKAKLAEVMKENEALHARS